MVCNVDFRHFFLRYDMKLDQKKKDKILHPYEVLNLNCLFAFNLYLQLIIKSSDVCKILRKGFVKYAYCKLDLWNIHSKICYRFCADFKVSFPLIY
jgi:hypothetical protein